MRHAFIDDLYAEYLKSQIGGGCPVRAKRALQDVCDLYSRGLHFKPLISAAIEVATIGQLESNRYNSKVRRWCLNVLALIGTPERSKAVIEGVIERNHNDPDTIASAVAAFFKVEHDAYNVLQGRSYVNPQQIALAAHIGNFGSRIPRNKTIINIEVEAAPILRSALVAVGLQRAPEYLFHPRFQNAELVRRMSQHDDFFVTQYAVWAINEHPNLGVDHLGFKIEDIAAYKANVRGWAYRLYGEANIDDGVRHDVIVEGAGDLDCGARFNLARGLRSTWYDGLDVVTCKWLHDESEADIREEILDHMVRQSEECGEYRRLSLELFEAEPRTSHLPQRMLASAKGRSIYREMKKLEYRGDGDLFDSAPNANGEFTIVTNNYNINTVQGGAVSIGGNAEQSGRTENILAGDQAAQLTANLRALAQELHALPNRNEALSNVTALVEEAVANPEPSKVEKVREALGLLMSGAAGIAAFCTDVTKITGAVEKVMSMLPPR